MSRVAVVALAVALVWGLWQYGATESWALYGLFLLALIPAGAALAALPGELTRRPPLAMFLAVGAVLLAQTVLRPTLEGRGYVLAALGWLALFASLVTALEGRRASRRLVVVLVVAGGLEALFGLAQAVGGGLPGASPTAATGTLVNRNHYAGLLNMILPLAMGAFYSRWARRHGVDGRAPRSETWAWSWLFLLSSSFMGLAILLSLSRGGTLTMFGAFFFMAVLLTLGRRRGRTAALSGLAPAIFLATVLGLGLAVGLYALWDRFGELSELSSARGRAAVYLDTVRMIGDHPVTGVGPGMYRWAFRPYQTLHPETRFDHAHNDYLETAAEWGLPIALAFWSFVAWRFYRASRTFVESRDPWRQGTALGCAGSIFSILLHSMVDFNLQIPANLAIFCVILALAWSLDLRRRDRRRPGPRRSRP